MLSGIVLAGANLRALHESDCSTGRRCAPLTADRIAGLDLHHVDLVVLSACDTGRGELAHGEGVFGLQWAFHTAGVGNVVASHWKVQDDATNELMTEFYYNYFVHGLSYVESLREWQRKMIVA